MPTVSDPCEDRGGVSPHGEMIGCLLRALALLLLAGCTPPALRVDAEAARLGFHRQVVAGDPFLHVLYLKPALDQADTLHVYLEGDGSPWLNLWTVAPDPTPRHPLMLGLMALDPAPALYLGRPCYQGLARTPPCAPPTWTSRRYSEKVIASMAAALRGVLSARESPDLVFLGHSGGGTLATLLAERFPQTRAVVTVAGNLDVQGWAKHHGYSPLRGSLDPSRRPPLPPRILQLHLAGARDRDVPLSLLQSAVARQPDARLIVFPSFDHVCCWGSVWRAVLAELPRRGTGP
jgi:hypothetical protein